jgi:hypothetical protein
MQVGRVVILTTHFMDEADLLADRIAIMNQGKLRCCGTSLFLKRKYGAGYSVTIEKEQPSTFDSSQLLSELRTVVPETALSTDVGAELIVQVPFRQVSRFPRLFAHLDGLTRQLGIRSYGVSNTSLEEIFLAVSTAENAEDEADLRAAETSGPGRHLSLRRSLQSKADQVPQSDPDTNADADADANANADADADADGLLGDAETEVPAISPPVAAGSDEERVKIDRTDTLAYFFRHMLTLQEKRRLYFFRDARSWIYQYLVPILFVCIGITVLTANLFNEAQPSVTFTRSLYNKEVGSTNVLPTVYANGYKFCSWPVGMPGTGCGGGSTPSYNNITGVSSLMSTFTGSTARAAQCPLVPLSNAFDIQDVSQYLLNNRDDFKVSPCF